MIICDIYIYRFIYYLGHIHLGGLIGGVVVAIIVAIIVAIMTQTNCSCFYPPDDDAKRN